jgi:MFS family permease
MRLKAFGAALNNIYRSLKYRNYRLFFAGQSVSLIGSWMQRVALPWLVYRLTDSPFMLGLVGFTNQVPALLVAPFAGVLIDRLDRRKVIIATQALAMVQAFTLAGLYYAGKLEVWNIIALGMILGVVNAFDIPARQSFVVRMVEKKGDLGNAIALNSSMVHAARLIGPTIAGIIIAATNEGVCLVVNGFSFAFVIVSLLMMRVSPDRLRKARTRVWKEFRTGFRYAFGSRFIRAVLFLVAIVAVMGMPYAVLLPVFAREVAHGGPRTFGFLMAASGSGALAGALHLASRRGAQGLGRLIPAAAAFFGVALAAFSLSTSFVLSMVLLFAAGVGQILTMASSNTVIQSICDEDKRGRVMSFYVMAFMGMVPFGNLLAGTMANWMGAPHTVLICGLVCALGAAASWRSLAAIEPRLRGTAARPGPAD